MEYVRAVTDFDYIGHNGKEMHARKGQVITIKLLSELKRITRGEEPLGTRVKRSALATNNDGFIEVDPSAAAIKTDEGSEPKANAKTGNVEESSIVQAEIGGKMLNGVVAKIYKDGFLRVEFEGDSETFRKMKPEDVKVLD